MSNITHYELTTIIDSNIPDNEHPEIIKKIKELITKNQGEIGLEENLGRKKLSYPIKKSLKGVFICLEFDIEPGTLKSIEKELKLNKNIIRYLIIKKSKDAKPIILENPEKETKKPKEKVRFEKKKKEPSFNLSPETPAKKEFFKEDLSNKEENNQEKETRTAKTPNSEEENDQKADLSDLDKKLDEILNDEIIN